MTKMKAFSASPLGFRQKSFWGSNGSPTVLFITQRAMNLNTSVGGFVEALMGCFLHGPQALNGPPGSVYTGTPSPTLIQSQRTDPTILTIDPLGTNVSLANYGTISLDGFRLIVVSPGVFPNPQDLDPGDIDFAALFNNVPFTDALIAWLKNGGRLLINGESNIYPADSNSMYAPFTVNNISLTNKIALNTWLGVLGSTMQLGSGSYVSYVTPYPYTSCPGQLYPDCGAALAPNGSPDDCTTNYFVTTGQAAFPGPGVNPSPSTPSSALGTLLQSGGLYGCGSANITLGSGVALYGSYYPAFACSQYDNNPPDDCVFLYNVDLGDRINPNNTVVMAVEKIGSGFLFLSGDASIYNCWGATQYGTGYPLQVLTNADFFTNLFWLPQQTLATYYAMG